MSSINISKRHFFFFDEKQILKEEEKEEDEEKLVSRDKRHVFWSDNNESAEKTNGGERFVEFDRE